jgi:flavin-dependent dehydrogenase
LGLAIRRSCFDTLLLNAASAENNVDVRTGEVVDAPIFENGAVTGVIARGHAHKASLVVAADGVNSPLRQKLGWGTARASRRFGVRRHYRASGPTEPWVDIFLGEGSETYVTPLPGQEIGIATLGDHRGELPPSLRDLEPIDAPLGAAPLTVRPTRRFAPGCVLLGDAAGSCDPITGGGISQALLSSELLARHLARRFPADLQTLAEFDRARERMLAKYRWLASGVLALIARPHLIRPSLAVLDQWPSLFTRLLAMAGGAPA